jgi:transglutaminase-like putative cysteine protease
VGFDPTNNLLPASRHVKICHGRDYFDVQPLKGIFLGTGTQTLCVEVDVERM